MTASVGQNHFGALPDGRPVTQFTLQAGAAVLRVLDLGGIVTSFDVPDRAGCRADVVLGFGAVEDYLADPCYHGALVGRFCNRIAGATFRLDGRTYHLTVNEPPRHLHGGRIGFNRVMWRAEPFVRGEACGLVLRHTSPDGDEGYPGRLDVEAVYTLEPPATWRVEFRARTDATTIVNLTQHVYFNLAGHDAGSYADHRLRLHASRVLPRDAVGLPTGDLCPVEGTACDFRAARPMREPEGAAGAGLFPDGYNYAWAIDGSGFRPAAEVHHAASGRTLAVHTTQPSIQFYNGFYNDAAPGLGKHGRRYGSKSGFALETQHFPDSPNQPALPSTVLRPGETFLEVTEFRMGVLP